MKIRLLQKSDIDQAAAIVGRNYSKKYEKSSHLELSDMFDAGVIKPTYFVAEEDDKIIALAGFIQSWMDYSLYEIFWVNVLPEKQRLGLGQKMVWRLISEIKKKKGACGILLTANGLKNIPKWYKNKFKFKTIQKFEKNNDDIMYLSLE
jgi:ribosomal protein S18 acetylase RimI-like enzyme